jgi:hypothetical protein
MISNPSKKDEEVLEAYSGKIEKNTELKEYSSEQVEKLTVNEIKELIQKYENL